MGSYRSSSLEEAYNNNIDGIAGSEDMALGFVPPLDGAAAEGATEFGGDSSAAGEEFPWEVVVGLLGVGGVAGGLAALAPKLLRKKSGRKQNFQPKKATKKKEEKKEDEEEQVKYILNLNTAIPS